MANRYNSLGIALKRGNGGSPETFTLIPQISQLDGPKFEAGLLDTTTVDDTYENYTYGVNKPGTLTFDLVWDPANAQHKGLMNDFVTKATRNFTINWSDQGATLYSFAALVKSFAPKGSPKNPLTQTVELQLSGAPTLVTT